MKEDPEAWRCSFCLFVMAPLHSYCQEEGSPPPLYEETNGVGHGNSSDEEGENQPPVEPTRFGWVQGVMVRHRTFASQSSWFITERPNGPPMTMNILTVSYNRKASFGPQPCAVVSWLASYRFGACLISGAWFSTCGCPGLQRRLESVRRFCSI